MKHLFIGAAAAALLAACGDGDKADTAQPPEITPQSVERELAEIVVRKGDPAEAGAALQALSLAESGAGRVSFGASETDGATATFTDVVLQVMDEDAPVNVATLSFEGLETTESGAANFGRMLMSDISIVDPDEGGNMNIGSVELVNPSEALAAWVASAMGAGEPADFPEGADVAFDAWNMDQLLVTVDEEGETQGEIKLDKLSIGRMADENAGQALLSGFAMDMTDFEEDMKIKVALGQASITGADLKVLSALQESAGDEDEMAAAVMSALNENPVDPGFDAMRLADLNVDAGGATFDLPAMDYVVTRNADGQPTRLTVNPFTMTLAADAEAGELGAQLAGGLGMVGYEKIELSAAGVTNYDPQSDIVSYDADQNYFTLKDGFTMNFGGKLEGYSAYSKAMAGAMDADSLAAGAPPEEAIQNALSALTVHGFEFSLDDDSFVDRMFNLAAAQMGEDPEAIRNQAVAMVSMAPMMAAGSGVDADLVTEATSAISSFLSEPGTLTLKLAPEAPLAIGALMAEGDPAALTKDKLGFSASND